MLRSWGRGHTGWCAPECSVPLLPTSSRPQRGWLLQCPPSGPSSQSLAVCSLTCPHFVSVQPKKTFMEQPLNAGTCAGLTLGIRRTVMCVLPGRAPPVPSPNPVRPVSLAFSLLTCTSHLFSFVAWYLAQVCARVSKYINQTDTPHKILTHRFLMNSSTERQIITPKTQK